MFFFIINFAYYLEGEDIYRFRKWFTNIALSIYKFHPEKIVDCGDLVRISYREALKKHDKTWLRNFGGLFLPTIEDISSFNYPNIPEVGVKIFALSDSTYSTWVSTRYIFKYNVFFIGKELKNLRSGDLIFFYQHRSDYHVMIYLYINGRGYVIYHTGGDNGELRLIPLEFFLNFPSAKWRIKPDNPNFLGFYRFKLLKKEF